MTIRICIDACDLAHRRATEAAVHGIQQGGRLADWGLIQALLDAAAITETAADFLLRSSGRHKSVCQTAAEVCDACADACWHLAADDLRVRECANAMRHAAVECRKLC